MKRKIILIASDDKNLPGVYKDIINYKNFFMSITGGAWSENEIVVCQGLSKSATLKKINEIKYQANDFIIVVFAGHGKDIFGATSIQLNNDNEYITQSEIENLSKRQISIYDCCRKETTYVTKMAMDSEIIANEDFSLKILTTNEARKIYEKKIMNSDIQQVILKSCSNDEYASDTQNGGLYSYNLLRAAVGYTDNTPPDKTVISAHVLAAEKVTEKNENQHPEYLIPRVQNKLILSINPNRLAHFHSLFG